MPRKTRIQMVKKIMDECEECERRHETLRKLRQDLHREWRAQIARQIAETDEATAKCSKRHK